MASDLSAYNNLVIAGGGTKALGGSATINGILTLTTGYISTGSSYTLTIGSSGSVTGGTTASYVIGNMKQSVGTGSPTVTFEVGTSNANDYTPMILAFHGVTTAGSLTVKATTGAHSPWPSSAYFSQTHYATTWWNLTNSGISGGTYDATFTFNSDYTSASNTGNFIVGRYYSSAWTYLTVGTRTSAATQTTGLNVSSGFGDFIVGDPSGQ
jgi:MSHA biogenesis protein MshQ